MRTRPMHVLALTAVTAVLLSGCAADDDVEELDAEFEQLEDDSGDSEPLDADPETPDDDVADEAAVAEDRTRVVIEDNSFRPASLEVEVGDTVTWTHEGSVTHTVSGREFDSGELSSGDVFEVTFEEAGTFPYECTIHQGMSGEIVVG